MEYRTIVELDGERYDELIAKEERLRIIETALSTVSGYSDVDTIKKMLGIKER